jgi:hypothetical protein
LGEFGSTSDLIGIVDNNTRRIENADGEIDAL